MKITDSRKKLKDYCLRRLGSPVINIELDDTQMDDRMDDAIQFFLERHFDGIEEIYLKKTITYKDVRNGYLTLPERISAVTNIIRSSIQYDAEVMDNFEYRFMAELNDMNVWVRGGAVDYYLTKTYLNLLNYLFGTYDKAHEFNRASNRLYLRSGLNAVASSQLLKDVKDFADNWTTTNSTLTTLDAETPNGELDGSTLTSDGVGTFSLSQTRETNHYVRGTYTGTVILKAGTYTGDVTIKISDRNGNVYAEETVTPSTDKWERFFAVGSYDNDAVNDLTLTIEATAAGAGETLYVYSPSLYRNNFVIVKAYRELSDEDDVEIYNDPWMKRYCTALFKKQWGENLKKYDQIQLPSGVTIKGTEIFQEALEEIKELEVEFAQKYEEPDLFFIG